MTFHRNGFDRKVVDPPDEAVASQLEAGTDQNPALDRKTFGLR